MNREVRVTPEAETNVAEVHAYICQDSPERAARWRTGIESAIESLAAYPHRCAVVYDAVQAGQEAGKCYLAYTAFTTPFPTMRSMCSRSGTELDCLLRQKKFEARLD